MKALVDRKEKEKMTDIPKEIKLLLAKFIEVILHDLLDRLLLMKDI
jgi:predicted transcriptional regulator YheO